MIKTVRLYQFNEWVESDNYIISKWYKEKNNFIKKLFETNELYKDLEYERFVFDSSIVSDTKFGYLFFNDGTNSYKLEIVLDYNKILQNNTPSESPENEEETEDEETIDTNDSVIEGIVIEEFDLILNSTTENTVEVISTLNDDELIDDFLINLISEWKEKNEIK